MCWQRRSRSSYRRPIPGSRSRCSSDALRNSECCPMDFNAKLTAALERLSATGISPFSYAPPLYRLLWLFSVQLPPPHFSDFSLNFAIDSISFCVGLALLRWLWSGGALVSMKTIIASAVFGFGTALYYHYSARKHGLPSWSELP